MNKKKEKYFSLEYILKEDALYNIIFGERSNGKTYSVHEYGLNRYLQYGEQMAIVRRWEEDYKGKRGRETFAGISSSLDGKKIEEMSLGQWNGIEYYSACWYLVKIEGDKKIRDDKPFCYAFALTSGEHDKSSSYNNVTTILFDEFLTRQAYLPDEFSLFMNTLSTIIRDRDNVKIFMLGNTVNKYCPYFGEMGLTNIDKMKQGIIDVYEYGESGLKVAVEWTESSEKKGFKKKSDKYFAFDNPKLKMITTGAWEIALYPHLPYKYKTDNIKLTYFISFNRTLLQCEIIKVPKTDTHDKCIFTYIHYKTTDLKQHKKDIIFQEGYSPYGRIRRKISRPYDDIGRFIYSFFKTENVYYQNNEVGEVVRNYLLWCNKTDIIMA